MRGLPKDLIQRKVYAALACYDYDILADLPKLERENKKYREKKDDHEDENFHKDFMKNEYELFRARSVSSAQEDFPKPKVYEYDELENDLEQDPKGKILTPKKTYKDGWVFIEHIEGVDGKKAPYGTPDKHRYTYLNNPLIETSKFEYLVRRKSKGQKNRVKYSRPVYRLKRDRATIKKLLDMFLPLERTYEGQIMIFSPYTREYVWKEKDLMDLLGALMDMNFIREAVEHKWKTGEYPDWYNQEQHDYRVDNLKAIRPKKKMRDVSLTRNKSASGVIGSPE